MKKLITLFNLFAITAGFSQAGAPAAYYNGFNWSLTGNTLKTALTTKISATHTNNLTYAQAKSAIEIIDLDPTDTSNTNLLLLYGFSNNTCPTSTVDDKDHRTRNKAYDDNGTAASCLWNREHTYPRGLGTPNLGTTGPGGDAHHLRASDKKRNADRDNDKFFAGSGNSYETGLLWYPGDEWKGDVARMMMYMYVRYGSQCLPINVGVGNPVATDTNMIDLFLQWNAEDPVSLFEDKRNTYLGNPSNTYGQGNRNPFIDNPYLATVIWGGAVAENRWPNVFLSTESFETLANVIVYPNPSNNNRINIQSEVVLDEIQLINLNGQLVQQIKKPVSQDNNYSLTDMPQGFYLLRLSSENQTITKKVIVN
ncbi:MAG: T9SS type A sorting domain-containing protein [Flavobacterium sp.]|nr:MAG: T9SS type A sorting domain-containing protein [Flavobacterium sp.]